MGMASDLTKIQDRKRMALAQKCFELANEKARGRVEAAIGFGFMIGAASGTLAGLEKVKEQLEALP